MTVEEELKAVGAASVRVADYLRTAILDGEIGPGERIRQEDVAERFGTSRLPVREALRILEAEGLTEHEPNKGARVPRLDMHQVSVVYQMRERVEPLALLESLPNLHDADLDRLDAIQSAIEANTASGPPVSGLTSSAAVRNERRAAQEGRHRDQAHSPASGASHSDTVNTFVALDREFHLLTYRGCRIDQLTSMVTRLWNSTQHYRRAFVSLSGPGRAWVINAEHRLLLDAIQRRDAVDAERYLNGHIRRTRIELAKHPEVFT